MIGLLEATANDFVMMKRALVLARHGGAYGEVPVGAVVYQGETILGEGFNLREHQQDPTAHAEMVAIKQAAEKMGSWRLVDCSMAVTLEPCPMCAGALVNARMARLIYGASDAKMGCVDTLFQLCTEQRFNHRIEVVQSIMSEEAGQLLSDFFKVRRQGNSPPKPTPKTMPPSPPLFGSVAPLK